MTGYERLKPPAARVRSAWFASLKSATRGPLIRIYANSSQPTQRTGGSVATKPVKSPRILYLDVWREYRTLNLNE